MTRYPKAGKGSKWTIKELSAIKPDWKGDIINDTEGLSGEVRIDGSKNCSIVFRYGFKLQGKKVWHYCGSYPTADLADIRSERDKARALVKDGIDPRANKKAERINSQAEIEAVLKNEEIKINEAKTFNDLYLVWIKDGVARADDNKNIIMSFSKHALPTLGQIELRLLTEHHLREVYRKIIADGKTTTAVALAADVGQMLRWAEKRNPWRKLLVDGNPSDLVEIDKLTPEGYTKERKRKGS